MPAAADCAKLSIKYPLTQLNRENFSRAHRVPALPAPAMPILIARPAAWTAWIYDNNFLNLQETGPRFSQSLIMMKPKRKIILISAIPVAIILLGIIAANSYLSHRYNDTADEMRFFRHVPASERLFIFYYDSLGYFPRSIDEAVDFAYRNNYRPGEEKESIRAWQMFEDLYSRNGEDIIYIPLYDYETKVPMSFIFLSAGIDGKINNKVSPNDTLYLNTWWGELDIYNYGEAVLVQDFWRKSNENWVLFDYEQYRKYYPPYPDLAPRFSLTKYLWGKKDWIIQIGLIDN